MTVYFLGGGNMAAAVIAGLHAAGRTAGIHVANRSAPKRQALSERYGVAVSEKLPALGSDDMLVIAVKPQDVQAACTGLDTGGALVLSLAAGLPVSVLSRMLGGTRRIIRAMPNTPAAVGLGAAALFADAGANATDKTAAEALLSPSCRTFWLDSETQMHAVTAVSGSGPAYVFYLMGALQQAAQDLGLDADTAHALAWQTFRGAAELAAQSGADFAKLQADVTSKGGTTAAALDVFAQYNIAARLQEGVQAAAARSQELARLFE